MSRDAAVAILFDQLWYVDSIPNPGKFLAGAMWCDTILKLKGRGCSCSSPALRTDRPARDRVEQSFSALSARLCRVACFEFASDGMVRSIRYRVARLAKILSCSN